MFCHFLIMAEKMQIRISHPVINNSETDKKKQQPGSLSSPESQAHRLSGLHNQYSERHASSSVLRRLIAILKKKKKRWKKPQEEPRGEIHLQECTNVTDGISDTII